MPSGKMAIMARVVVVDDHPELIDLLGSPLVRAGHRVLDEVAPLDFDEIMHFAPQVIVAGVSRRQSAVTKATELDGEDLYGYHAIANMVGYPAISLIPILVVGVGVFEREFPLALNYDLFLTFPDDMGIFVQKVGEFASLIKTRRRISAYVCPSPGCGSRLAFLKEPIRDLSCPRCGVGVALIDETHGTWLDAQGVSHPCLLEELRAPVGRRG